MYINPSRKVGFNKSMKAYRIISIPYILRKIQYTLVDNRHRYAYVISFAETTLIHRRSDEYFKSVLSSDETLTTENKCFKITAIGFEVSYCIEAWKKHEDTTAYIENADLT